VVNFLRKLFANIKAADWSKFYLTELTKLKLFIGKENLTLSGSLSSLDVIRVLSCYVDTIRINQLPFFQAGANVIKLFCS
jgi:hypothetical protein